MPEHNELLKTFYEDVKRAGAVSNLPDYDAFKSTLSDPSKRRTFYKEIRSSGMISNLPDYSTFNNKLFSDSKPEPKEPQISTVAPDPEEDNGMGRLASNVNTAVRSFFETFASVIPSAAQIGEGIGEIGRAPARLVFNALGMDDSSLRTDLVDQQKTVDLTQTIQNDLQEIFPDNPEYQDEFLTKFSGGAGSLGAFMVTGALTGGAGAAALGSLSLSGAEYKNAIDSGASEDEAFDAFLLNLPVGATEAIPVGKFFRRLDRVTSGGVKQAINKGVVGGLEEMTQEIAQQTLTNTAASQTYDKTREILNGVGEGGAVGFGLGFLANALGISLKQRLASNHMSAKERSEIEAAVQITESSMAVGTPVAPKKPEAGIEDKPSTITIDPNERPGTFKKKFREWFLDRGNLPKEVFRRKLQKDQNIQGELQRMRFYINDLNSAIEQVYKPKGRIKSFISGEGFQSQGVPQEAYQQINEALAGQTEIDALPEQLQNPTRKMRNHIDRLSRKLIEEGVVEGELGAVIDENIGVYMNRSYRLFDDPKWAKKIPSDIRNEAKAYIRDQYKEIDVELNDQQVNNLIDDILYTEDAPLSILGKSKMGSKDLSILRQRKDIAPEIRALMGEYSDPIVNYSKSIYKMANLIENHRFLTDVRDQGMGKIFFAKDDLNRPEGFNAEIAAEGSEAMAPLNGLRTSPEIKQAFEDAYGSNQTGPLMQWYLKANAAVKYGKTVGSVTTHVRNVLGGGGFMIANGHLPNASHVKEAFTRVKQSFGKADAVSQERIVRLKELGVLSEGANVGELRGYLRDANIRDLQTMDDLFSNIERSKGVFAKARKSANSLTNLYQAGDDFIRMLMFESEVKRYQEALPDASRQEIEEMAGDIISRTYQNYDRVPKVIRSIRKIPAVGMFASFPAEVVRTTYNTAQQARTELASDNPAIRRIGQRRRAGLAASLTLSSAVQAASMYMAGVMWEELEDFKRFLPPWAKNASLMITDKSKGFMRYMNLSYTDPHEYLVNPVLALAFGIGEGNPGEATVNMLKEFFEPFLGEELLFNHLANLRSNTTDTGAQIYNPQAPLGDQAADMMGYLWEAFEPGTFSQAERTYMAYRGITNEYGKKYNLPDELMGMFGMRFSEVDVEQSLGFKAYRYSKDIADARRIYNSVKYRSGNVDAKELDGAYKKAVDAYRGTFEQVKRDWDAAYRLGVPESAIRKRLKEGRLSNKFIDMVDSGRFEPFDR